MVSLTLQAESGIRKPSSSKSLSHKSTLRGSQSEQENRIQTSACSRSRRIRTSEIVLFVTCGTIGRTSGTARCLTTGTLTFNSRGAIRSPEPATDDRSSMWTAVRSARASGAVRSCTDQWPETAPVPAMYKTTLHPRHRSHVDNLRADHRGPVIGVAR